MVFGEKKMKLINNLSNLSKHKDEQMSSKRENFSLLKLEAIKIKFKIGCLG